MKKQAIGKRPFGNTGISVSPLGFGAGHIGSPSQSDKEIEQLLNSVLDSGISLIDTARSYGSCEERIGKFLSHRRSEFVVSTKIGYGIPGFQDWTGPCITVGIDAALGLLRTDYIDIVHFHSCPVDTLRHEDILRALQDGVNAGKVRVPAYSGDNESLDFAIQTGVFKSIQTSINLFDQRAIDTTVARAHARGMGVIAKRPIANAAWRHTSQPHGIYGETYWLRLQKMKFDSGGIALPELALRFAAFLPVVDVAIIGTSNIAHLKESIGYAMKGPLPEEVVQSIRTAFHKEDTGWEQET